MLSRDFPILSINLQNKHRKQNNKNKMKDFEVKFSDCNLQNASVFGCKERDWKSNWWKSFVKLWESQSMYKLPQRKFQFSVPDGDVLYIHNIKDGKEKSRKK